MFSLPASTAVNRSIPKQKFYERLDVSVKLRRLFVDQVAGVVWRHKLSPETLNLAAGERARELQVFEVALKGPELDQSVLKLIDRGIPYPILFILSFEDKVQARIGYKTEGRAPERYFGTGWLEALPLRVEGLNVDAVYAGFIRQIAPEELGRLLGRFGIEEALAKFAELQELKRKIATLENKVRKEQQLNRQVELNAELKRIRREFAELYNNG